MMGKMCLFKQGFTHAKLKPLKRNKSHIIERSKRLLTQLKSRVSAAILKNNEEKYGLEISI